MKPHKKMHAIGLKAENSSLLRDLFEAAQTGNLVIFSDMDKTLGSYNPGAHTGFPQDDELLELVKPFGIHFVPVTGRPKAFLRTVFGPNYKPFSATEHGAILYRHGTGKEMLSRRVPDLHDIRGQIDALTAAYHGAKVEEHKQASITAEFTAASNALDVVSPALEASIRQILESDPKFADVRLINGSVPGNCYIELVHKDVSKGAAVEYFMTHVPEFRGKRAIFLGDSPPDESGMRAAQDWGTAGGGKGGFALGVTESAPEIADFTVKSWQGTRKLLKTLGDIIPLMPKSSTFNLKR